MKKVIVLGAGMVGSSIARDLHRDYSVTAADVDSKKLEQLRNRGSIKTVEADLSDFKTVQKTIQDADLVIGALPGFMGFANLKTVIQSGKNTVDISFFAEDPFELDALAKRKDITAVMDCGVAPGMSNLILGYHNGCMSVESFECLVGGLPYERTWPYQYKAPFSPIDVLEEYTRPARIVENGKTVTRPALSESEYVEFDGIGTLEAFNTDGLRTLIKTMNICNMKEKTLRYPGHIDMVRILKQTGFLDKEPITIQGNPVRPLDVTTRLLLDKWKLKENEPEFTVMKITIRGKENGIDKQIVYHLFDQYDQETQTSSMARTTGYACTAVARLILEEKFNQKGIVPPEWIGANPDCYRWVLNELGKRKIRFAIQEHVAD